MTSSKKIELHLHLEGAAPPDFIRELAGRKKITLPDIFDDQGHYTFADFREFLQVYEAATSLITTPEDDASLLMVVLENCAAHGAIYAELFVSPEFCGNADLGAWREYVAAMSEAAAKMEAKGITSRAIITAIRHFDPDRARKSARCAAETAGDWVTGFGMGGAEQVGDASDFAYSFDMAREARLGLTCHAGEWKGPESVWDALDLGVTRIGHGVRAIEDPDLVRELVDRKITLEVCPGSNLALGIYPDIARHPIARLLDAGVRCTISTDDPPFFHTDLGREYDMLSKAFGWAEAEFSTMNHYAIDAAFCDDVTRARLRKDLT